MFFFFFVTPFCPGNFSGTTSDTSISNILLEPLWPIDEPFMRLVDFVSHPGGQIPKNHPCATCYAAECRLRDHYSLTGQLLWTTSDVIFGCKSNSINKKLIFCIMWSWIPVFLLSLQIILLLLTLLRHLLQAVICWLQEKLWCRTSWSMLSLVLLGLVWHCSEWRANRLQTWRTTAQLVATVGQGERCKLPQRGPKMDLVHSAAVRKPLVATILSILKCMFYSRWSAQRVFWRPS